MKIEISILHASEKSKAKADSIEKRQSAKPQPSSGEAKTNNHLPATGSIMFHLRNQKEAEASK